MIYDAECERVSGVEFESDVDWKKGIDLDPNDDDLVGALFEFFFPRVRRHDELIDEYQSSRNSPYCGSIKH